MCPIIIDWTGAASTANTEYVAYIHSDRSYMGSHGASYPPPITCTLLRHYNVNRFIASTKATSGTDGGDYQAAISRWLPRQQSLPDVAVTGKALGTWTHSHGIPGLGMLQSSYPSVESVLPGTREGLDMQKVSGLHRTTRRTSAYPLGLRRCVEDVGLHHHAVDANRDITHSNGLVK